MKKGLFLIILLSVFQSATFAQILDPVHWSWKAEPTGKGQYKLIFTAKIDPKWHVYSQKINGEGPIPTSVNFDKNNKDIQLVGATTEAGSKMHEGMDEMFGIVIKQYETEMVCTQVVKVLKDTKLKGMLEFMACDDGRCTPPQNIDFEFDLKASGGGAKIQWDTVKPTNSISPEKPSFDSAVQAVIEEHMPPTTGNNTTASIDGTDKYGKPISNCGETTAENTSLLSILLLGLIGGLVALVTPCVFPMIPLTVSFFTKRSESKTKGRGEAFFYSFSIVFIYFLISVPFLLFDISPSTLNEISTGAALNIFFFLIFVVFAFSFFGFYEITLPSFIANKADSASNVGGLVGIFFMALTLVIVSFSCTGPLLGSLLVASLSSAGGKLNLVVGMTAFGFALALPFGLFALFPEMMKSLPKSGGWLNSVKVVLGFVELIFAIKFLSNADLVSHWGILKREIFLGSWAILGAGAFIYLIGKLKFPHDSPVTKLSPVRATVAVLAFTFTVYSAYGIPGNALSFFSGFPPPMFYSIFATESAIEPIHNNYEEALAKAKAENKPIMIDFTGFACVNCRKMEENVWSDAEVKKRLMEKYVVVSLYVDDKQPLPEDQQYVSKFDGKKINTVGRKFSDMQATYFGANTQPYYILISPDEKLLNKPKGFTPDTHEYVQFLDCGLEANKKVTARL